VKTYFIAIGLLCLLIGALEVILDSGFAVFSIFLGLAALWVMAPNLHLLNKKVDVVVVTTYALMVLLLVIGHQVGCGFQNISSECSSINRIRDIIIGYAGFVGITYPLLWYLMRR